MPIRRKILFDLFDFAANHPARSESDTYYADQDNVLRTHDTVMWYYYLNHPDIKMKISQNESFGVFCFGKSVIKNLVKITT